MRALLVSSFVSAVLSFSACGFPGGGGGLTGGGAGGGSGGGGGGSVPAPVPPLAGERETWDAYAWVVPPRMVRQTGAAGVELTDAQEVSCRIALLPLRTKTGELAQQALDVLRAAAGMNDAQLRDETGGTQPLDFQRRTITRTGFAAAQVEGTWFDGAGVERAPARVLLVDLGAQVAPVLATGPCFLAAGDSNLDWAWLVHSLEFPARTATALDPLRAWLPGKWRLDVGTGFLGETYAANQRYGITASETAFAAVTGTEVTVTSTSFTGDGRWELTENRLSLFPTTGTAKTQLFRIDEQKSATAVGGWVRRLHKLDVSQDGTPFEYVLRRQLE